MYISIPHGSGSYSLYSKDFSGKNTGVGCHALLQGSSQPRDQTCIACVPTIAGGFFTHWAIRKAPASITWLNPIRSQRTKEPINVVHSGQPPSTQNWVDKGKVFRDSWERSSTVPVLIMVVIVEARGVLRNVVWMLVQVCAYSTPWPRVWGFPDGSVGKESTCNEGDIGDTSLIPGSGRSPGEGNGTPLQYSCLGNPMDGGAWRATVQRVEKSWTRPSD